VSDEMKYNIDNSVAVSLSTHGTVMNAIVTDQIYSSKELRKKIPVKVVANDGVISINAKGYDFNHDEDNGIITLEVCEGRLRLIVWADKNNDAPTHVIDLEKAKGRPKKS
jgi:hypothetical protein